jgi:hypothetical protein
MRATIVVLLVAACGHHDAAGGDAGADGKGGDAAGDASGDGASAHATTITVTLVDRPNNAAMFSFVVAYQDGAGAWQVAPPPSGDTYSFQVTSPAYGVAWTCITPGAGNVGISARSVNLYYFAVAERTSLTALVPRQCTDRPLVGLTGTISNPPVNSTTLGVAFGRRQTIAVRGTTGDDTYALETPKSTHDLIVGEAVGTGNGGDFALASATVQRGLAVTGATIADVDYSNAQPAVTAPVTVVTTVGARVDVSTTLSSAGKTQATFVHQTGGPFVAAGLADALADSNDVYQQQIVVVAGATIATEQVFAGAPAAQRFVAPTPLGTVTPSVASRSPYVMLASTWSTYANAGGYVIAANQTPGTQACGGFQGCTIGWTIDASPGYLGAAPQLAMPDLSGVTGWDARLELVAGVAVIGSVTADTSSAGAADFPQQTFAASGVHRTNAGTTWQITP